MRLFRQFKRELSCADLRAVLIFALGSLVAGMLSALIGGSYAMYYHICLPRWAPSPFGFWLIWTVFYLLIGIAAGLIFSDRRCSGRRLAQSGILCWAVGFALSLLWSPLFFGRGAWLASLLVIPLMILCALRTVKRFARASLLAAFLMLLYVIWLFLLFFLQVAVILCN